MIQTEVKMSVCRMISPVAEMPEECLGSYDNGYTIPLKLSVLPSQWDAMRQTVVSHPQKQLLNTLLAQKNITVDSILFRLALALGHGKGHDLTHITSMTTCNA